VAKDQYDKSGSLNQTVTQVDELKAQLQRYAKKYKQHALWWVVGYRVLLVSSALLSASAAVVVNLDVFPERSSENQVFISRNNITAILAASSTVFTTLLGTVGFENNWRANRLARDRVEELLLELLREQPDREEIISTLQRVIESRLSDFYSKGHGSLDTLNSNKQDTDQHV
jgi:beta-lactamase regulating signal transducer with metallopeptidase domain